jgi:hypothetical protein
MDASKVDAEHDRLGYSEGWAFLMSPEERWRSAQVVTVGLNPGSGDESRAWDYADGNYYLTSAWDTPLHRQVRAAHQIIGVSEPETAAAQFIPFRSSSIQMLQRYDDALTFSRDLWGWALAQSKARLFICMGQLPATEIASLIEAKETLKVSAGWGTLSIKRFESADGRRVIQVPHLSRFQLFSGRPERVAVATDAFREAAIG